MDNKSSRALFVIFLVSYLILAFLYIIFVVQPTLYFHHLQPAFILSADFLGQYFDYPGGFSELVANFLIQSYYYKYLGPIVLFTIAFAIMWLTYALLNTIYKSKLNSIWALFPLTFTIILTNNYNFPFSIIISIVVVLILLLLLAKKGKRPISNLLYYTAGAVIIYYLSGSGYMLLFSLLALFFSAKFKIWARLLIIAFIVAFSFLFPLIAYNFIFPIPFENKYFYFYAPKLYFMAYEQSGIFYIYLLSLPVLVAIACILTKYQRTLNQYNGPLKLITFLGFALIIFVAYYSHQVTFKGDEKKIVASDYYCYNNNVEKTAKAATSLNNYNFIANINYNMVMGRAGRLTQDFFKFFQISGTDAVHPDNEFLSEISFIAADFYYDLGYISEARHWAYESLVFYPYSPRTMQILVKIHLITREYKAAEHYLKILNKGLIDKNFVDQYMPYIIDTARTNNNKEIIEKRSFIPAERELNPLIHRRFQELLEANSKNKSAYEYLMLYYLLDSQLESFMELYKDAGKYFNKPALIYEEAILMYGAMTKTPVISQYNISPATVSRFNDFTQTLKQYAGNERLARNFLYREYGKSYMYYLQFLYPRIIKSEIIGEDDS